MAEAAPKEKWKMARYRPTMDFAKVNFCTLKMICSENKFTGKNGYRTAFRCKS